MPNWMSKRTADILKSHKGITIYDFDPRYESIDADVTVSYRGWQHNIRLGEVKGLSKAAIDGRFRAAFLQFAVAYDDEVTDDGLDELYAIADELMATDTNTPE